MTTVTFDGVELKTVGPLKPKEDQDNFEITIECVTNVKNDIDEMIARAGKSAAATLLSGKTKIQTTGMLGTLEIDGVEHENCAIMGGVQIEEVEGTGGTYWKYKMRFVQADRAVARPAWYTTALIGQNPEDAPVAENMSTSVFLTSDNYVDLPLSTAVMPGIVNSVILATDNYADIPVSDPMMSAITHALTIVNDV